MLVSKKYRIDVVINVGSSHALQLEGLIDRSMLDARVEILLRPDNASGRTVVAEAMRTVVTSNSPFPEFNTTAVWSTMDTTALAPNTPPLVLELGDLTLSAGLDTVFSNTVYLAASGTGSNPVYVTVFVIGHVDDSSPASTTGLIKNIT